MIVDLGTGDGRAVLARADEDPAALVIGIDASAASMAESSRRADRRGPSNAVFFAAGVEALSCSPLAGQADVVTIAFPWGSLLRGVLGLDDPALCGIASVARPGGRIEVLVSVVPADGVSGMDRLDLAQRATIDAAWWDSGLRLMSMRYVTPADLSGSRSSWARRLGPQRPVWRLDGVRSTSIAR